MQLVKVFREARLELHKVIFPIKEQVKKAFISVAIVVTIITIFLSLIDVIMSSILSSVI
jgi:preprotein translocase subunit SecE